MGRELYNINWFNVYLRDGSTCGSRCGASRNVNHCHRKHRCDILRTDLQIHSKIDLFVENHGLQTQSLALLGGWFQYQTIFVWNMPMM